MLTHLFSGASLFLYTLYNYHALDLEDTISVEPLDIKQITQVFKNCINKCLYAQDEYQTRTSRSTSVNALILHQSGKLFSPLFYALKCSFNGNNRTVRVTIVLFASSWKLLCVPSIWYFCVLQYFCLHIKSGSSAKQQFLPLSSVDDFFSQLKAIVGKCFGLMLALAAGQLEPLLEASILVENFAMKKRNEIPSLRPIRG